MTSSAIIKQAVTEIAIRVQQGESVSDLEALAAIHPDGFEGYCLAIIEAQLRKDAAAVNRNIRDAQMNQAQHVQLALPGIPDAALPALIRVKDDEGKWVNMPFKLAPRGAIEQEILAMERKSAVIAENIAAYRQSWDALCSGIPVSDDMTGGDIIAMRKALMSGE